MITATFTYTTVDMDECDCDTSDHGFYDISGHYYSMNEPNVQEDVEKNPHLYHHEIGTGDNQYRLKDIIKEAKQLGIGRADSFLALASSDPDINYQTGEHTHFQLHFGGSIKPTSYRRIVRLFE